METRNTKQKEVVLDCLKEEKNMFHPTAQEIVELVSKENPSIGQSTVYRNINKLVDEGILIKIPTNDSFHYDINTNNHAHFCCKKCDSIVDLHDNDYQDNIKSIESKYKVKIDDSNLVFNGVCEDCNGKI